MKKEGLLLKKRYNKWTREEIILALDLYCKIPFSKISKTNKEIIKLAELIGRSPSAVGLKMANLARFDKGLKSRNISGMSHGSKLDEEIWNEFCSNWGELTYLAQQILASKKQTTVENMLESIELEYIPAGEYREKMTRERVGQYFFRMSVLSAYSNKCCITGLSVPEMLVASHIKPWKVSEAQTERTNPCNGLCLNALHDKAFDRGLITINSNYIIIVSHKLRKADMDNETKTWIQHYDGYRIRMPDRFLPGKKFIEYHNDAVFLR